jgi:hypothetical protein
MAAGLSIVSGGAEAHGNSTGAVKRANGCGQGRQPLPRE